MLKKKEKLIGSVILCAILLLVTVIGYMMSKNNNSGMDEDIFIEKSSKEEKSNVKSDKNSTSKETETSNSTEKKGILVEIKGEVKKPDVYLMKEDSIVKDLVKEAGGATDNSDTSKLNLAQKLRDGMCIVVPNVQSNTGNMITAPVSSNVGISSNSEIININTATKEELKKLPSVGDVTADKIIAYREKNGGFKTIEDIKKVDRIGESTFNKLKDKIDVK
ncbi:competence protein ComEA [Clostridium amylolyticum]|uniref:Competence protein ComEA n=1 Tax=Clostridium amylolyticum TaxID=1121298 RepID=A0A1M6BGL3_9CLOT|nr:ComEA family DNA-binding protein [Clostridium amylolyticum]SHI47845.1 competence protein ComEA [Clostridium amylolyticum]